MGRLDDRVAVITGAGQGIGRGVARRYAREGCRIVVAELNEDTGRRTVGEVEALGSDALFVPTNVSVKEQAQGAVNAAVEAFGRVDILVNNAWGGGTISRLEWKSDAELEHGLRTGFMSNFWTMQAAFPHMKAQGRGSIINLCSLNGVNAHMYSVEYNIAKEAVRAMTRHGGGRMGPASDPLQRHLPGGRDRGLRGVPRRQSGHGIGDAEGEPDGPHGRPGGGHRRGRAVPRVR